MQNISLNKILYTEHLLLRAISLEEDIELAWDASRIKGFNDGMVWNQPEDKSELASAVQRFLNCWREGAAYTFTIILNSAKTPIGRACVGRGDDPSVWGLGFWIHPASWGNGFAAEASQAIIEFAFTELGALKIKTAHAVWNSQSKRVIEQLGFHFIGENPCGFVKNGMPVAVSEYELVKK